MDKKLSGFCVVVELNEVEVCRLISVDILEIALVFVLFNGKLMELLLVVNKYDDDLSILFDEMLILSKSLFDFLFDEITSDNINDDLFWNPLLVKPVIVLEFGTVCEVVFKLLLILVEYLVKLFVAFSFSELVDLLYKVKVLDGMLICFDEKIALTEEIFRVIELDEFKKGFRELANVMDLVFPILLLFE